MRTTNTTPDEFADVNRVIIIGNGFDLAHGLKSSFNHFVDDYLYNALSCCEQTFGYSDDLIEISIPVQLLINRPNEEIRTNVRFYFERLSKIPNTSIR